MGCVTSSSKVHPEIHQSTRKLLKQEGFDFTNKKRKYEVADVNMLKESSYNPAIKQCATHVCSFTGDLATLKWLHDKGADLRVRNSYNQSPLLIACQRGNMDIADYLYSAGCADDMTSAANDGCTPLHLARGNACVWVLDKLSAINENKDPASSFSMNETLTLGDNHGDTPLLVACLNGDITACKHIVRKLGLLVSQQVKLKKKEVHKVILSIEAPVNAREQEEVNHLKSVEKVNTNTTKDEAVNSLKSHEVDSKQFIQSVGFDKLKDENMLCSLELHINHHGSSLLHNTSVGGHNTLLIWLLREVAGIVDYVTREDCCGDTPLKVAAQWGNTDCCYTLIQHGALVPPIGHRNQIGMNRAIDDVDTPINEVLESLPTCPNDELKVPRHCLSGSNPTIPSEVVLDRDIPISDLSDVITSQSVKSEQESSSQIRRSSSLFQPIHRTSITSSSITTSLTSGEHIRKEIYKWAARDIQLYYDFRDSFLVGCMKKRSPVLSNLRKASRDVRDRPKQIIADFAGVVYGFRLYNTIQLVKLLDNVERPGD